jgi:hypothetical protein
MPWGQCPICRVSFHLSVGLPIDEWYRKYWPQLQVGEVLPELCPRCGIELRPGHRVTVRVVPDDLADKVAEGNQGTVFSVEAGEPPLYLVHLEGATPLMGKFRRSDLFYVVGQKSLR